MTEAEAQGQRYPLGQVGGIQRLISDFADLVAAGHIRVVVDDGADQITIVVHAKAPEHLQNEITIGFERPLEAYHGAGEGYTTLGAYC